MLSTPSIKELSTTRPDLYAFRIQDTVSRDDMKEMALHVNEAFDVHEKVDMLLYFEDFEGSDPDAGLSLESMESRFRALGSVRRYVVVNAPEQSQDLVNVMGRLLPVQAETFDSLDAAFEALSATSMTTA